jgi:serine/threonine-protein kinase
MGAVMYFMLTGSPPFDEPQDGPVGLIMAHVNRVPERPSQRCGASLPADLESVVMRCLEKSPAARYADARELAAALRKCEQAPAPP